MTTIITKNGTGVPANSSLATGELAVDTTNKRIYTSSDGTNVSEVGTNPSTLTVDTNTLVVDSSGDKVAINDATGRNATLHVNSGLLSASIGLSASGTTGKDNQALVCDGNDLYFTTNATRRLTIDGSGNVGIGTSSPDNSLTINTGGTSRVKTTNGSQTLFSGVWASLSRIESSGSQFNIGTGDANNFVLRTNNTDRMTINSSGNVGIGTATPVSKLHTTGSLTVNDKIYLQRSSASLLLPIASYWNGSGSPLTGTKGDIVAIGNTGGDGLVFANGDTERMRINSSGNLLVATSSGISASAGKLQIVGGSSTANAMGIKAAASGTAYLAGFYNTSAGAVGFISTNGSSTTYSTSSDQRLKENIVDADDAGSKIDAIQVRKFDWIADGSHQDYGMVAQELQTVAPEAVLAPEDPEEMMGVDYSKLVPMLVKEIQSLRARVAQLEEA